MILSCFINIKTFDISLYFIISSHICLKINRNTILLYLLRIKNDIIRLDIIHKYVRIIIYS